MSITRKDVLQVVTGGLVVAALLSLAGCGGASKQDAPDPTPDNIVNGTHTQVIQMPDGFRNVATTCRGTTGIYVTSRGWQQESGQNVSTIPSSIFVLANDPSCGGTSK